MTAIVISKQGNWICPKNRSALLSPVDWWLEVIKAQISGCVQISSHVFKRIYIIILNMMAMFPGEAFSISDLEEEY